MGIDTGLNHIEELDTELYPKNPMANFVDGLFSSEMAKRLSGNESKVITLPDHPWYKPAEFSIERPKLSQEEFETIGKAVNGEVQKAVENFRAGKKGSILGIERDATTKLVDSGFVPESLKSKWKYFDDEEKCFAVYPLVQSVHSSMMGGPLYEALPEQQVIETHAKPPKKSRKRTGIVLGILGLMAAGAVGGFMYKQYVDEQTKKPYKDAGLTDQQASQFVLKYQDQNGNSSWVEFAKYWAKSPELADTSFLAFIKDLKNTLSYLYFADSNHYDGMGFLRDFRQFINDYKTVLPLYSADSNLLKSVYLGFLTDPEITHPVVPIDANKVFVDSMKYYQDWNLAGKNLQPQSIYAVDKLLIAYELGGGFGRHGELIGLPVLDKNTVLMLINATQDPVYGKYVLNFDPIKFSSVDGKDLFVAPSWQTASPPSAETWLTAKEFELIKQGGFDITKHPEMFLGLNGKTTTNYWCVKHMPGEIVGLGADGGGNRGYTSYDLAMPASILNDSKTLDLMMLQWKVYSQFAPQVNASNLPHNTDFPWYNSNDLTKMYQDMNQLRCALFRFFYLPSATYNMTSGEYVKGIEGAKTSLLQAQDELRTIARLYPNGTVIPPTGSGYDRKPYDPRYFYEGWLLDRANNGLPNTVAQYRDFDQFLTKNWKDNWDLAKFIVGYERYNPRVPENPGIYCIMPDVLRMVGFPVDHIGFNPQPAGAGGSEWAVGLPPDIAKSLSENFPNTNILLGPGYTFGLYSCGDGLVKDGATEVDVLLGGLSVYLMKKG